LEQANTSIDLTILDHVISYIKPGKVKRKDYLGVTFDPIFFCPGPPFLCLGSQVEKLRIVLEHWSRAIHESEGGGEKRFARYSNPRY
jgi:hypothetical protein